MTWRHYDNRSLVIHDVVKKTPFNGTHLKLNWSFRFIFFAGNILLNILLTSAIPTKRQGKNNVFIVCVPNPPISTKDPSSNPVPMLIRVKTPEDADELLAKMEECKGSSWMWISHV